MDSSTTCLDRFLSETSIKKYPPLPPELLPQGRPMAPVTGDWGTSIIYDLAPIPTPPAQKFSVAATRPPRKSLFAKVVAESSLRSFQGLTADTDVQEEEEVFWCLPFFQASMLATVHEDVILKMRILSECNTPLRVIKTLTEMPVLLAIKYSVEQVPKTDELEGINPKKLNCNEYKIHKLDADRAKFYDLIISLYVELSADKCFTELLDYVNTIIESEQYAVQVVEDEARNNNLKKELNKKLRLQRNHHKTVLYEVTSVLEHLRSQIEDATLMTETNGRYVDHWQSARTEQHRLTILEKENIYTKSTEYYKRRSDHECRVHAEVETLTNIIINETLQEVEDMMDKYEREMEKVDLKIQMKRNEYQTAFEQRRAMESTYKLHAKMIKDWVKFKDDREKANEYHRNMTNAAIIVQAWWRGLIVRKQLGPYRPKKGKKGGGKKK